MKKFYTLCLAFFLIGACLTTLAGTLGTDKPEVGTELVKLDALSVAMFDLNYVSEDTLEVIRDRAPRTIGKPTNGFPSLAFHPPTTSRHYLFSYSKRL
jgi:hypothetical protein